MTSEKPIFFRLLWIIPSLLLVLSACKTQSNPEGSDALPIDPMSISWEDQSGFGRGLVRLEKDVVNSLVGASVYHTDLQISADYSKIEGRQQVRYTNQETISLSEVVFRLFPNGTGGKMTVSGVRVDGQKPDTVLESQGTALRVLLLKPISPGQSVVIQMDFMVEVPRQLGGNYGLLSYYEDILALDGIYPSIAVYDDQGWHAEYPPVNADLTYTDASFYLVRVTAPSKLVLAASGILLGSKVEGETQISTFAAGPARAFYLAGSEKFSVVSQKIGETTVNSYAFPKWAKGAEEAEQVAEKAIEIYSRRFGAYPYTELDVVSTPMTALGIEYPGIVGISTKLFDPDQTVSGLPSQVLLESVVAHEIGHQWFYNLVGNDQQGEPWLDESVTQYATGLYYLDRYGVPGEKSYQASWKSQWALVGKEKKPIGLPADQYTPKEYSPIIYGRGPFFVSALADQMGQSAFDDFIKDYVKQFSWENATGAEFKQLAEQHCQCDLTSLFKEWVFP